MASQEGFEPPTTRLEGECSIQLSYWDTTKSILARMPFALQALFLAAGYRKRHIPVSYAVSSISSGLSLRTLPTAADTL